MPNMTKSNNPIEYRKNMIFPILFHYQPFILLIFQVVTNLKNPSMIGPYLNGKKFFFYG